MKQDFFTVNTPSDAEMKALEGLDIVRVDGAAMAHISTVGNPRLVEQLLRPYRMNSVVAIICIKGGVTIASTIKNSHIGAGQIYLSLSSVLQFENVADSEFYLLAFGPDFLTSMNINIGFMVDMMTALHNGARIIDVKMESVADMALLFKGLYENNASSCRNHYTELSLRHLFCSIIYRIYDAVADVGVSHSRLGVKDRSAEYFERLLHLLEENFREQRNVEFYAEKMNISSKHLSRVIRSFTGKSVHQWIDDFVALEIKNLLRYSDMSIQQISYALNFPNPSFMGQYFKRITGMTPGAYKRG